MDYIMISFQQDNFLLISLFDMWKKLYLHKNLLLKVFNLQTSLKKTL